MLFNSVQYIFLFLPVTVWIYYLLNRKGMITEAKAWLVCASLFFYGFWNFRYILLLVVSLLVNYMVSAHVQNNKRVLWLGLLFNVTLLLYYKYCDFFIENINWVAGTSWPLMHVLLPLGISFFTFQKIAYQVDTYRGKVLNRNFLDFCLFVTFFPQLIAGPIVHHAEIIPQFNTLEKHRISWRNLYIGAVIFFIGLFKKLVIADFFGGIVSSGYDVTKDISLLMAWMQGLMYTLRVYFDFSGYSDMAIGAALMMNIDFPQNFNSPYKAANIREYWSRWHMTLSRWLREYIYKPLGGSRVGSSRTIVNLWITFFIGGAWHGANWTFVAWGMLHATCVIIHRFWSSGGWVMPQGIARLLTFIVLIVASVIFQSNNMTHATSVLKNMVNVGSIHEYESFQNMINASVSATWMAPLSETPSLVLPAVIMMTVFMFLLCFYGKNTEEIRQYIVRCDGRVPVWCNVCFIMIAALSVFVLLYVRDRPLAFMYFNF